MIVFALFTAYLAVAGGFYALITRTAVPDPEEAHPILYVVEGQSEHRRAA